MLTKKLLAGVGLAGALLVGATTDASANPWRPHFYPVYRPVVRVPVYRPVYRPVYAPVPVYRPPVVVYAPAYQPPVYVPAYRPVVWRHPGWSRVQIRSW